MKSFTRSACVLVVSLVHVPSFAASASDLLGRVTAFECESLLAGRPPVDPGPAPQVPSGWRATAAFVGGDSTAFARRRVARADLVAHEDAVIDYQRELAQIERHRSEARAWWRDEGRGKLQNIALDPSLRPVAEALVPKVDRMVDEARTIEQIARLRTTAGAYVQEVLVENEELRQRERRAQAERRRQRRETELRFDLATRDNAPAVAAAFDRVAPGGSSPAEFTERLRTDLGLKGFIIDEVQLLRRLRRAADDPRAKVAPVLAAAWDQRAQNDRTVLNGVDPATVIELRRALLSLNRPGLFRSLGGASPRRMNLELRERIVADALANESLALTILQAGLNLVPPPTVPTPPRSPSMTPPSKPYVPHKARSRSHYYSIKAEIDRYKANVKSWQAEWEAYKRDVPRYKQSTFPAYVERVKQLREAYDRTAKARQSFVAYLSYRQPAAFASPAVARTVAEAKDSGARARLAAGARSPAASYVRSSVPSTVHSSTSVIHSSNDDWFLYWLLYNNTLNPYYAVNPHGAYALYQHDAARCAVGSTDGGGLAGVGPAVPAEVRDQINQLNQDFSPSVPDLSLIPDSPADLTAPDLTDPVGAAGDWAANVDPNLDAGFSDISSPAALADVAMPDVSMPDVSSPDFSMPDISIPDVSVPSVDVSTPSFDSYSSPSPSYDSSSSYSSSSDSSSSYSSSDTSSSSSFSSDSSSF